MKLLPTNVEVVGKCTVCGGLKVKALPPYGFHLPIAECRSCGYVAPKDLRAAMKLKADQLAASQNYISVKG